MVKRSYTTDSLKWVGVLTLSLCLFGSGVLASDNSTAVYKSATKSLSSQTSAKTTSAGRISKISNLELIYADGGVRLRVHTGSMTEFTHQIEPPKNGRPYRIILDCLNAHHNLGANSFRSLPSSVIQRIRTSQFAVKPQPITRIVLDLGKEAFYRVEQNPKYIDLFVTDRKAKRFNSWSSASWVAEKNAKSKAAQKSVKAPVAIATTVSKPEVVKSAAVKVKSKKSETATKSIVKVSSPLVAKAEPAVRTVKKTVATPSPKPAAKSISLIEKKPVAKKVVPKPASKPVSKPAVKSSLAQKPQVESPVIAKAEVSKKPVAKVIPQKVTTQKVAVKKSSSQKSNSQVLASSKPAAAKSQVKAAKKSVKVAKKAPVLAATKPTLSVDKKSVAKKSVAKKVVKKAPAKITAKDKSTLASKSSSKVEKPKSAKKIVKTTKTVKKSASNSSAKLANVAPSKISKSTVSKSGISKSNASKKSASKKSVAKTANSKAALASKKSDKKSAKASEKKKAVDNSSSLFATTANAATPGQQTYKDADKDRRYKAQFRRSIDQRKIKLKSTLVAEFPKRLTIKYKTHGSRDPFGTLLVEAGGNDDFMMKELPNVEALTMVGILRDVKGKTRGLFEDIDGRGYILSKGDKVRSGTVLKITKKKAYFQIFEYGWSRTVALSLEG